MVKIACQAIVYGNQDIKDNIENILKNVAENKYDGVEIGARHFYMDKPDYYIELLNKNNLEIPAIHVGGNFLDKDSVSEQVSGIGDAIKFAKKLDCKYLFLSGTYKDQKTDDDYLQEARVYEEIGKRCTHEGLVLCYHNHDWEFANNGRGMELLLEHVNEELMKLVPDVGWITVAGANPVDFIKKYIDRTAALHFKDFKNYDIPRVFIEIGDGIVDFEAVYRYFSNAYTDFWIIAEQDMATNLPEESAKTNQLYIRELIDKVTTRR